MPQYPTNDPTDDTLYISVDNASTALSAPIDDSVVIIPVLSTAGFPDVGFVTMDAEKAKYTSKDATNFLGVTRGTGTTLAAPHLLSAPVTHTIVSDHHNNPKDEIIAIATDLRDAFKADLDDGVSPATTAPDIKERLDQIVTAHKNATGESDWKDTPSKTIAANANAVANNSLNLPNLLINGSGNIWQRGASFAGLTDEWTADRWEKKVTGGAATTFTVSEETSIVDSDGSSIKVIFVNNFGGSVSKFLEQEIENFVDFKGKTVSLYGRIRSDVAPSVSLAIDDGISETQSSENSTTGVFETLSVTKTISASATKLAVELQLVNDCTCYFDSIMLVAGSQVIVFVPEDSAIDMHRAQRYYEILHILEGTPIRHTGLTNKIIGMISYRAIKAATPTVTFSSSSMNLYTLPSLGNASLADTANWAFVLNGAARVDELRWEANRTGGDQTTYDMAVPFSVITLEV